MRKTGKIIKCKCCNKKFYASAWELKKKRAYCSAQCHWAYAKRTGLYTGKNRWNFNKRLPDGSKRLNGYGYIMVKDSKHKNRNANNYILEHRQVISKKLKRALKSYEHVHHINYVKTDNRRKNLYLCSSISEHTKITTSLHNLIKILLDSKQLMFNHKTGKYFINENFIR